MPQTVTSGKSDTHAERFRIGETADGKVGYRIHAIGCSNPDCKKVTVIAEYGRVSVFVGGGDYAGWDETLVSKRIKPDHRSISQPDFIPEPLRDDYYEACLIRDLSPKASATLSRRCLQGMIRDFCGISKARLVDEIKALRRSVEDGTAPSGVSADSIDAIDNLREIGNIGAHMEKDINVIVDVDPNEAQALIELVESLFEEWYVAREKRQRRFARVAEIATRKDEAKKGTPEAVVEPAQ